MKAAEKVKKRASRRPFVFAAMMALVIVSSGRGPFTLANHKTLTFSSLLVQGFAPLPALVCPERTIRWVSFVPQPPEMNPTANDMTPKSARQDVIHRADPPLFSRGLWQTVIWQNYRPAFKHSTTLARGTLGSSLNSSNPALYRCFLGPFWQSAIFGALFK